MADPAANLHALVQQSREEQALISSKILALSSGWERRRRPGFTQAGDELGSTEEVQVLREQVAELDSALLERDAKVDELRAKVSLMQAMLDKASREPQHSQMWQHKYEQAQLQGQAHQDKMDDMKEEENIRHREVNLLTQYIKKLQSQERDMVTRGATMLEDGKKTTQLLTDGQAELDHLEVEASKLQDDIVRCVGRVTRSMASGIVTASIGSGSRGVVFAVLREGALEIFEQPESKWEIFVMDMSPSSGVSIAADPLRMEICVRNASGETAQLYSSSPEEYAKWVGAMYLMELLPQSDLDAAQLKQSSKGRKMLDMSPLTRSSNCHSRCSSYADIVSLGAEALFDVIASALSVYSAMLLNSETQPRAARVVLAIVLCALPWAAVAKIKDGVIDVHHPEPTSFTEAAAWMLFGCIGGGMLGLAIIRFSKWLDKQFKEPGATD